MSEAMALMTITCPGATPGVERAAELLGVERSAIDASFGIVAIDPSRGLYAVQVKSSALASSAAAGTRDATFQGPFSNPHIEGFGPKKR